jgi:uncharacterized protein (DUF2126 family)/transglutaminase-like putative cysteine protease
MAIHVALHHVTSYKYDRPVTLGPQVVRLRPAPHCRGKVLSYSLRILPEPHFINWQQDPQSNWQARLVFPEKTTEFRVEVDLVTEMAVYNPFDFFLEPAAEEVPFAYDPALAHELEPFVLKVPLTPRLAAFVESVRRTMKGRTIDFLVAINQRLQSDIRYLVRMEPGVQSPEETLEKGSGSCRDSAWLLCQVLRHTGMAARFVSGYLIQLRPDVKPLDGPAGADADFTDLHAWCEVYLPGAGWIGLDPTSGLLAGEGHLPLAATPDPQSAAPISGGVEKCEVTFDFQMRVQRIHESPRVTFPCTDEQWADIEALGERIDRELEAGDVRLTMGGEPTFVSIDDPDGAEWNTDAVGPDKRLISGDLIRRLRQRFGQGGLLHYGTGKWYPGEQLPRWALGCFWRRDGVPVWQDDSLIADERRDYSHGIAEAQRLMHELVRLLAVDGKHVLPGYEDIYYHLWRERRLPANVDPLQSNLKDELERARLRKIFQQGLGTKVGWALPLKKSGGVWETGSWFLREETLYLTPGDSPMGLRLPLDSLPWVAEKDYPWQHALDPMTPPEQLPVLPRVPGYAVWQRDALRQRNASSAMTPGTVASPAFIPYSESMPSVARRPARQESAAWLTRTALCVEPREGRLHVFMPPARNLADYLELTAAVEEAARITGLPVIVEGESPPFDPRLHVIKVTPDPGVIEVNMHPAQSWRELSDNTAALYEEARLTRLGTEKFMLDGRHTGTGGGNHIVMGGLTPADSPLLRRPDLLRSLLAFWHNHPSLSYLFSGLFIGPTSQHPRVDEARNDALYELELAFRQIPDKGSVPPWLVDRIFRNLLADITGNTHRTEFSIDKLFSPETSSGRLGLVELRSFEMPPHERMSLAQHLLLRAAIARFWKEPYSPRELARWGTELHDRWLLPHFVWEDFTDVLAGFSADGYAFDPAWFAPHFEFRFPHIGTVAQRGVEMELRTALEPWHVLGEEPGGGSTVRYVDSSLERLQIKVRGLTDTRHLVLCNGRRVPLHPTGVAGEAVAGIRYRAWQPPSCLQPTIPPHAPLVIDLYDTWNRRSLGGGAYHVAHPGGRSYDTFPVNAWEAESRRLARFIPHGHTPGLIMPEETPVNREFPMTLDLRRS